MQKRPASLILKRPASGATKRPASTTARTASSDENDSDYSADSQTESLADEFECPSVHALTEVHVRGACHFCGTNGRRQLWQCNKCRHRYCSLCTKAGQGFVTLDELHAEAIQASKQSTPQNSENTFRVVLHTGEDIAEETSEEEDDDDDSSTTDDCDEEDDEDCDPMDDLHYEGEGKAGQDYLGAMRVAWFREHGRGDYNMCDRGASCSFACFSISCMRSVFRPGDWIESHGLGPWFASLSRRSGVGEDKLLALLYSACMDACLGQICRFSHESDAQAWASVLCNSSFPWAPCQRCHDPFDDGENADLALLQMWRQHPSSSSSDWAKACVAMGLCTFLASGVRKVQQDGWHCLTCSSGNPECLVCTSCVEKCHEGHNIRNIGCRDFTCACNLCGDCNACDFGVSFKGVKSLPKKHTSVWFGEYLRSVSERSRLRGAVLRCILLCLGGRGNPCGDTEQNYLCLDILRMLRRKNVDSNASCSWVAPTLLKTILQFV